MATLLHPDSFETLTIFEHVFTYFLECIRKCDFFDPAEAKTPLSDVLHTAWDFNALEILAVLERFRLEPLQRGWKFNCFYRTFIENSSFPVISADNLCSPEFLQTFVQQHTL